MSSGNIERNAADLSTPKCLFMEMAPSDGRIVDVTSQDGPASLQRFVATVQCQLAPEILSTYGVRNAMHAALETFPTVPLSSIELCVLAHVTMCLLSNIELRSSVRSPIFAETVARVCAARFLEDLRDIFREYVLNLPREGRLDLGRRTANPRVALALRYLSDNRGRRLTLLDVARRVNLSAGHLERLLKQETSHCFRQHVWQERMSGIRDLLRGSTLSIKEIAAAVGYGSSAELDRHFKTSFGTTPRKWRATHQLVQGPEAESQLGAISRDRAPATIPSSRRFNDASRT